MLPTFLSATTEEASGATEQERNAEQIRRVQEALAARSPKPRQPQEQRWMRRPQEERSSLAK